MRRIVFLLVILLSFSSCKSSKRPRHKGHQASKVIIDTNTPLDSQKASILNMDAKTVSEPISKAEAITNYAKKFEGVRYKWGGTTTAGMDCSGLVFESFRAYNIILPRISRDMAKQGDKIPLKRVQKGDLLFFKTRNRRNAINHVGLIVTISGTNIEFIHATTSAGVIISKLSENYWTKAFVEARRIL